MSRWVAVAALVVAGSAVGEEDTPEDLGDGYTPSEERTHETLRFTGYVDVGFAAVQGNGSSFAAADRRVPADYGVDAFAPAVNARGEVGSTDARGLFTNGFLPRSTGIGGQPSFLLNTLSADVRYAPASVPVFVFARLQVLPRLSAEAGTTRVELQQAFGRVSPFVAHEFAVSLGKFDSVFGVEYLDNEANLRVGITPSLISRYTTGQSLGLKGFYRLQLPGLWSALSLNAAATTSGARIEALADPHRSLSGIPVGAARLGYELNLQRLQVKLGGSGLYGPRADQAAPSVKQMAVGADVRVSFLGVSLVGEVLRLIDEPGRAAGKLTGLGAHELASGFTVTGFYVGAAWALPFSAGWLDQLTVQGRYDHRQAKFEGFGRVEVDRFTVGVRLDLFGQLALKAEVLINREVDGAPDVANDVFTSSAVFSW